MNPEKPTNNGDILGNLEVLKSRIEELTDISEIKILLSTLQFEYERLASAAHDAEAGASTDPDLLRVRDDIIKEQERMHECIILLEKKIAALPEKE